MVAPVATSVLLGLRRLEHTAAAQGEVLVDDSDALHVAREASQGVLRERAQEARTDQAEDAANAIRQVMESRAVADIGLPLIAEAGIGDTWGRAH